MWLCARTGGWVKHKHKIGISASQKYQYCIFFLTARPAKKKEAETRADSSPDPSSARTRPNFRKTLAEFLRILFPRKHVSQKFVLFRFPRQDCFQNKFEFCTMNTANFGKAFLNPKYGRREAPSVLHSPRRIQNPKGFSTLRVAPRLPMQIQKW